MSFQEKEKYVIKAVEKALLLLNALSEEDGEFGVTYMSQKLGLQKNIVFRLLATFEKMGYVEHVNFKKNYRLGIAAYETGQKLISHMNLLNRAKPVMERLVRECNETIYLVLADDNEVLMIDKVDTTNPVNIVSLVGRRYPMMQSSIGKVIQAFGFESIQNVSAEGEVLSPDELKGIRNMGACEDVGGLGDGIASLAVPLLDARKKVLACLCFVGPQYRFTKEKIQKDLLPRLKAAGRTVSSQLGYLDDLQDWEESSQEKYPLSCAV